MDTPIIDFVKKYSRSGFSRLHMPGHKGKKMLGAERIDITEISGADVLYSAGGIIENSMQNAAKLFGTAATFYSTEGSTLSIKAMLAAAINGIENPRILAARNVHKAFVYACALLDIEVEWLYSTSGSICECKITADTLEKALEASTEINAVYVTSPDYLGNILDISALSKVCKKFQVPLLVDNAHGAYLKFLQPSVHPIDLGAAMCADSAHKTLPVLTGGGYLHISREYSKYANIAYKKMSVFASTSPSYLILQSLDNCNKYLACGYSERLNSYIKRVDGIKQKLNEKGFKTKGTEPLKITVDTLSGGYTGEEFAEILRSQKIEPEFYDNANAVLMLTPENNRRDFARLNRFIKKLVKKSARSKDDVTLPTPCRVMSIREAVLADSDTISVEKSVGKICAAPAVCCPPAIPVVISGEKISAEAVEIMKKYNIEKIEVIKGAN